MKHLKHSWSFFSLLFTFLPVCLAAQPQTIPLTNSFKFRDGVFQTFEQFQQNEPAFFWDEISGSLVNTSSGTIQVESLFFGDATERDLIPLENVWGFVRSGVPYIQIPSDSTDQRRFGTFVALRLIGKICLFSFETEENYQVPIRAYNPLNGRPFREGFVTQTEMVTVERLLYFPTGEIAPLNRASLVSWMRDDPDLLQAFLAKEKEQVQLNRYEWLEKYNERNRVYTLR